MPINNNILKYKTTQASQKPEHVKQKLYNKLPGHINIFIQIYKNASVIQIIKSCSDRIQIHSSHGINRFATLSLNMLP